MLLSARSLGIVARSPGGGRYRGVFPAGVGGTTGMNSVAGVDHIIASNAQMPPRASTIHRCAHGDIRAPGMLSASVAFVVSRVPYRLCARPHRLRAVVRAALLMVELTLAGAGTLGRSPTLRLPMTPAPAMRGRRLAEELRVPAVPVPVRGMPTTVPLRRLTMVPILRWGLPMVPALLR